MPPFLRNLHSRYGTSRGLLGAAIVVAAIGVLAGVASWASAPTWVPLFTDLPLETVGQVGTQLDDSGIRYRLQRGGSVIEVVDTDVAKARVALAQAGLPGKGRPGFELFDQPSWGMTDFTQRINYRRALEGELERSIGQMRGVDGAQVHLALREGSVFRRSERPVEASVLLRLRGGMPVGAEQVEAITFLVASSVEGLSTSNISVLDDAGRLLSAAVEPGSAGATSKRQVALQRETETYLEQRAEDLVSGVVGSGNARVRVSAALNFDRVDRTTMQVDPDRQVVAREERSEVVPGTPEQGASSTIANATYETSRMTEVYSSEPGSIRRLTVAVLVNETALAGDAGGVMLARLESLVRNAVGIDDVRGDAISVVGVPFEVATAGLPVRAPESMGVILMVREFQRPALGLIAALLAFIVALQALRTLRGTGSQADAGALLGAAGAGHGALPAAESPPAVQRAVAEPALAGASFGARPDSATRVLRAWMKDA